MSELSEFAKIVLGHLREHFDEDTLPQYQVLNLAEEAGEFVGAYRRWAGMARRSGTFGDMAYELADVVITAYVAAEVLGIDLDMAVHLKQQTIMSRGWREATTKTRGDHQ